MSILGCVSIDAEHGGMDGQSQCSKSPLSISGNWTSGTELSWTDIQIKYANTWPELNRAQSSRLWWPCSTLKFPRFQPIGNGAFGMTRRWPAYMSRQNSCAAFVRIDRNAAEPSLGLLKSAPLHPNSLQWQYLPLFVVFLRSTPHSLVQWKRNLTASICA